MPSIINATTTNGVAISPDNSGSLQLQTNNGTTAVTIDTSQNVGVGTSSPASKLQVVGQSGFGNGAANSAARVGITQTGNDAVTLELATGSGSPFDVSLFAAGASPAHAVYLNNRNNSPMVFQTNNTERMRITSGGSLCFATTSETPASSSDTRGISLWTNGTSSQIFSTSSNDTAAVFNRAGSDGALIRTRRQGSDVGSISVTGSATAYNTSSDYRLKENIAPMTGALEKVTQLKPVTYNWKVDGSSGQGFIAHELQEIVPDCVTGEKDAVDEEGKPVYQGVDTSFLVATLTAAIQELKAELDSVKAELNTLKNPPVEGTE